MNFWAFGLLLLGSVWVTTAETYYVVALNGTQCPDNTTCHELSYYTNRPDLYFTNNTIFYFLEGTHQLTRLYQPLVITGVTNLTLQGLGEMVSGFHETVMQTRVTMRCTVPASRIGTSGLAFMHSSNIIVRNITLADCGYIFFYQAKNYYQELKKIRSFAFSSVFFKISFLAIEVNNLTLQFVSVQNSTSYGTFVINGYGVSISHSSFSNNTFVASCNIFPCRGGNAVLVYTNPITAYTTPELMNPKFKVTISHSNFSFGVDLYDASAQGFSASGLFIGMEQSVYGVDVLLDFVVAYRNTAQSGANIAFLVYESVQYYTLTINNTVSSFSNRVYPLPQTGYVTANLSAGGGLLIYSGIATRLRQPPGLYLQKQPHAENPVAIINSDFSDNFAVGGGGMFLNMLGVKTAGVLQHVNIVSCRISQNIGYQGMGMYINTPYVGFGAPFNFLLKNVTVSRNKRFNPLLNTSYDPTITNSSAFAVFLFYVLNCTIEDLSITDNEGAGMLVLESGLSFLGTTTVFKNNSGKNGGGISMHGNSFLFIHLSSTVHFINNHASHFGGALYIDQTGVLATYCFYQLEATYNDLVEAQNHTKSTPYRENLVFSGNTADIAGSLLYGGDIENCLILQNYNIIVPALIKHLHPTSNTTISESDSSLLFDIIFNVTNQTGLSVISSSPVQVCFCSSNTPNCSIKQIKASAYPGTAIQIPFATLGQMRGIAPGVLKVEERVESQLVRVMLNSTPPYCSNLSYTITKNYSVNSTTLFLSVNKQRTTVISPPTVSVDVSILACPVGFELSSDGQCDCDHILTRSIDNITCDISTLDITRRGNAWIGYNTNGSCLSVDDSCPFDYCNPGSVSFNITNPDPQCALNRSGVLCGECAQGLSLFLGSNKCGECSNAYLSLLFLFALAGFALVVLLITLNLTVSVGTINGLIFYTNVVKLGEAVFFPNGPVPVLSQFISWLNLDLGIETCFYNGMDSYIKTWLQFAFPFYVWIIMIAISVLAHYSMRVSKLVSRNTIPVLATLILLSYVKLFRTVTLALLAGSLACGSSNQLLWSVDANIGYFETKHLLLGVFALIVLLFLAIPFTLILLFSPLVEHFLARPRRLWKVYSIARPFFDAYGGPYEDKYRFWTGLLLLVRLVLVLVVSFSDRSSAVLSAIVSTTAVVMALAWWLKGVYRQHHLNVLECWFLLNLLFLVAFAADNKAEIGVKVSGSIVLTTFIGIVFYHAYTRVKKRSYVKKLTTRIMPSKELHRPVSSTDYQKMESKEDQECPHIVIDNNARRPECTTVMMLREPLLETEDGSHSE